MKLRYQIKGMSCGGCASKVKSTLLDILEVTAVDIDMSDHSATIDMSSFISVSQLNEKLNDLDAKYSIDVLSKQTPTSADQKNDQGLSVYKPLFVVFAYIFCVSLLASLDGLGIDFFTWMRYFMAGFFLCFSFFKMLDLESFSFSYAGYDVIAKIWRPWAYIYAFIELGLGIAYVIDCCPLYTNILAFFIMSLSLIGVVQSVMKKQKIQCACLGSVFNLPMSTVTIVEDVLMIAMSGAMILKLII